MPSINCIHGRDVYEPCPDCAPPLPPRDHVERKRIAELEDTCKRLVAERERWEQVEAEEIATLIEENEKLMEENRGMESDLAEALALLREARLAMMEPTGEDRDWRCNRAVVGIRALLARIVEDAKRALAQHEEGGHA